MVKKKNKRAAKRKERLAKLYAPIRFSLFFRPESSFLLSPYSVPALVPALVPPPLPAFVPASVPAPVPALVPTLVPASFSRLGSSVVLLSSCVPAPAAVSHRALILPLFVLGPPLFFGLSSLRTYKQFLSDEPRLRVLTSPAKPFRPFPAFSALNPDNNNSLYNSTDKNKRKRGFNTVFM